MTKELSKVTDLDMSVFGTTAQVNALRKASFPTLGDSDFIVAMKIAKQYNLDPFAKEIWWWEQTWKTMIVVAYAGYLRIARSQPGFIQIETQPVCADDTFSIDYVSKEIIHKMSINKEKTRQKSENPVGAWCRLRYMSQGVEQVNIKYVEWAEYAKGNVWLTNKSAMICKVAWTVTIREVYGLSGLYIEEELYREVPQMEREIVRPDLSKISILQDPVQTQIEDPNETK